MQKIEIDVISFFTSDHLSTSIDGLGWTCAGSGLKTFDNGTHKYRDLQGSFKKFQASPWKRFRKMILLRLQTITSCKTITSITDIYLLFLLQIKPIIAVWDVWNSKDVQNRGSSNNKVSAKETHDTWRYFGFKLLQDSKFTRFSPVWLYLFPKLKSHLPVRQFGNNPCCRGVFGEPGCNHLPWGDCNTWR